MVGHDFKGFKDWKLMDSIVYLSFLEPKTQKEAVQLVYEKSYNDIDMRPFREARNRLGQKGSLKDDGSVRNTIYTSSMQPFLEQVKDNYREQEGEEPDPEDVERLYKIVESECFRSFFNKEVITDLYWTGRNENNRLDYSGAGAYSMMAIGQVLRDLWAFGTPNERLSTNIGLKILDDYDSLDDYIDERGDTFFLNRLEVLPKGEEINQQEIFDTVKEGHNMSGPWREHYLNDLVFESQMFYQLPKIPPKIFEAVPSRKHSYYSVRKCNLPEMIKSNYRLNPGAYEDVDEDIRQEFQEEFERILQEKGRVEAHKAVPNSVELDDEDYKFFFDEFTPNYLTLDLR